MKPKLRKIAVVQTINGIGHRTVGGATPYPRKYRDIARTLITRAAVAEAYQRKEWQVDTETVENIQKGLFALCNLARVTLTDVSDRDAMHRLVRRYGLDEYALSALRWAPDAINMGSEMAKNARIFDFDDQLWLPYAWGLQPEQFNWVLVDEAQDLNAAQRHLVLKCRAPGGRVIAVGDKRQAIYGFAGADAESFERIAEETNATMLPLSICYRSPSSHLDLAREIVPQIEPRPDAPVGTVDQISERDLPSVLRPGDMVLCRMTAPLITLCLQLIAQNIPATVKGREIGKQLGEMVDRVLGKKDLSQLPSLIRSYRMEQAQKLAEDESQLQSLYDRLDAIECCYMAWSCATADAFKGRLESLFSDKNEKNAIVLSTVHKAKGLEGERVFILKPNRLPLRLKTAQQWQIEQERNLLYVALTRAKSYLCFVRDEDEDDDDDAGDEE
jgi:superfamily I DNA/RNA helicase